MKKMSTRNLAVMAIIFFLVPALVQAEEIFGLPLHIEKTSDKSIRLWVGDYISSTAVNALATKQGIVVIDTTQSPGLDAAFRKIIARELGRNDFKYLINTHEHGDHTQGNQVYADCEIIAHTNCIKGMKANTGDSEQLITWATQRTGQLKKDGDRYFICRTPNIPVKEGKEGARQEWTLPVSVPGLNQFLNF